MSAALVESEDSRRANAPRAGVAALIALGFGIVFFGALAGMSLMHLGEDLLGAGILVVTTISVALLVVVGVKLNRTVS